MPYKSLTASHFVKLAINGAILLVGLLLLAGVIDFTVSTFWVPGLVTLTGVFVTSVPVPLGRVAGFSLILIGIYLILRYADVIAVPYLQYGLGGLLVLIGAVNLSRDARGGSVTAQSK